MSSSRSSRRAWLWGFDEYAGRDYSHRKAWVLERMAALSTVFTIDVCAYAIMANHYHLVVHVDQSRARALSQREVVEHWASLYSRRNSFRDGRSRRATKPSALLRSRSSTSGARGYLTLAGTCVA